jgi:Ca-activated chloride channel family protein
MNAGLWVKPTDDLTTGPVPVPLAGVAIAARLAGPSAEVVMRQRFVNAEARPIEAVYLFPLPTDAAVSGFGVEIDGRRIEGRVEEREKAFETYDDALADGHGAFLVDQERPNVFTVSVGNLPPGKDAVVELRWVLSCPLEGAAVRFQVPTTVSPRYTPKASAVPRVEVGQPDDDKLNPERRTSVPYGLTLTVEVEGVVAAVSSPSHPIETRLSEGGAQITFGQTEVALDRDIVLLVEPREPSRPHAIVARDGEGHRYAQVTFVPDFAGESEGAEVVFLVDCSGSMGGDSIAEARRALELCIRALDPRDRFDIVRFGSTFECLFGQAKAYDEATLNQAVAYVRATDANLGGTEILEPLRHILERPRDATTKVRQVLLLTDGQVSNESDVIALAKQHADRGRIFAFGIGAGVSEHLVREVARQSRGEVELIYPGERIEPKVLRQFGRVRSPALTDIAVDWGGLEVEQAPRVVPTVFSGEPLTVWARVKSDASLARIDVALSGGGRRWTTTVDLERAGLGGPVPALWGRAAIRDLESDTGRHGSSQARPEREGLKTQKLVELGRRLGLVSSATSYVAVEVRAAADRVDASQSTLRRVPIALTAGWHGIGSVRGGLAAGGAALTSSFYGHLGANQTMHRSSAPQPSAAPAPAAKSGGLMKRMAKKVADVFSPKAEADHERAAPSAEPARMRRPAFDLMPSEGEDDLQIDEPPAPRSAPSAAPLSAAPGHAPAPVVTDPLYSFLMGQRANGAFVAGVVPTAITALAAWNEVVLQFGEDHAATAVVLALLERDFADRRAEWKAAAEKARRFLGAKAIDVSALVA